MLVYLGYTGHHCEVFLNLLRGLFHKHNSFVFKEGRCLPLWICYWTSGPWPFTEEHINFNLHRNHLKTLLKCRSWLSNSRGGTWNSAFLIGFLVLPMLFNWGPQLGRMSTMLTSQEKKQRHKELWSTRERPCFQLFGSHCAHWAEGSFKWSFWPLSHLTS